MIKKLLPYSKKYIPYAILSPLFIVCEVMMEVRIPFTMAKIVDYGIMRQDISAIYSNGLVMVVMALISLVCGALAARFAAVAGIGFGSEVRKGVFGKIQDFSFSNTDKFSTASLITRLTTDINMVQNTFMMSLRMFIRAPLMLVSAVTYATRINSKLAAVFFAVVPLMAVVMALFGGIAFPRFKVMFEKYDKFNSSVQENLIAIRVVKAYVRSKFEKEKFKDSNDDLKKASVNAEKLMTVASPFMMFMMYSCIVAVLWFGSRLILGDQMKVGELASFISYITQILMSLMMLSVVFVMSVISRASITRLCEIIDEVPDISDKGADPSLEVADGSVEFKNIYFKYGDGKYILENINLSISSGETIGIIGGTGSSKTSLVQLIPRLYDADEGEVIVGGRHVKDYTLENLRQSVSMTLQKNLLFSGTIEQNLRWGDENASLDELRKVSEIAQADNFVSEFTHGYATELGQGGVNVSGGQKQRLCIARALLKKPKILILDDSTSAVDTHTDSKIREGLKKFRSGMTTIIIAQRIHSIESADRIVVLDNGKIDSIGTHSELLKTSEIYKEVYVSQLEGSDED
ncbi:MAG: ABC transporter ATP-binding protein [Clostridiales bacterium]|nr:ABC transporter ATP-binding protein [Clostridiales bacterium]